MNELTRNQASTIFQARTRMLKVKENYKKKYGNDLICRACGLKTENQLHVLKECQVLHQNDTNKITEADIFTENPKKLK